MEHIPVLLSAILDVLQPKQGETVIDCTVGLGGHAKAFLERIGARGKLIGIDADRENLQRASESLSTRPSARLGARSLRRGSAQARKASVLTLIHANFRDIASLDLPLCDILFADLGLSSPHLDDPMRGFSFRSSGPLDCRYDRTKGQTVAELLRTLHEEGLLHIFREYGELPRSHALVEAILAGRSHAPLTTTHDLVHLAETVYGWRSKKLLPQIFQALRIAVNDELGALEALLRDGSTLLNPGGRMGILSYHSLEDRLVKSYFHSLATAEEHPLTGRALSPAPFRLLTPRALKATLQEVGDNPRARSCRFRAVQRLP